MSWHSGGVWSLLATAAAVVDFMLGLGFASAASSCCCFTTVRANGSITCNTANKHSACVQAVSQLQRSSTIRRLLSWPGIGDFAAASTIISSSLLLTGAVQLCLQPAAWVLCSMTSTGWCQLPASLLTPTMRMTGTAIDQNHPFLQEFLSWSGTFPPVLDPPLDRPAQHEQQQQVRRLLCAG